MTLLLDTNAFLWFIGGGGLFYHRDPFDRLLAAQAIVEGFPIVSSDRILDVYGVSRIW